MEYIMLTQNNYMPGETIYELAPSHDADKFGTQIIPSQIPFELAIKSPYFFLVEKKTNENKLSND